MGFWGKIVGSFAGFAFGGPLGALLGAVAGHAVDKMRDDSEAAAPSARRVPPHGGHVGQLGGQSARDAREMAFSVAVIVLGAKMAKVDGAVTRSEINAFKQVFRIPADEVGNVARIFDAAKQDATGFEPYARQVGLLFRHEPAVLEELLAGLFHIARADGPLQPAELTYLRRVAGCFGLDQRRFEAVRARFASEPAGRDPFAILGLDARADDEEIKRTYRRLIRENHPDSLIAKGLPRELVEQANEKMAAINAAYDDIARRRGLK